MRYVLLDMNNLCCRCVWANADLKTSDGRHSGVHYGTLQSLISLKRNFSSEQFLIIWDGKSKRRMQESETAVVSGIIPEPYKANRKKEEMPQPLKDFYEQAPYLQRGLGKIGIPQIRLENFEADDVAASYVKKLKNDNEIVIITSDQDYYQLLDSNKVIIYDGMKQKTITEQSLIDEYGVSPQQWIEVGALEGDAGDNIFGIPGFGEKTAIKEIKKYGNCEKLISAYKEKHKHLLLKYPDYTRTNQEEFAKEEQEFKTFVIEAKSKKGKNVFPEVNISMPFARVCLAFAKEEVEMPKVELMALMFQERIKLAHSLKKMDDNIPNLPAIRQNEKNEKLFFEYLSYYEIESLKEGIKFLLE